jgi:NodT family efflux transporter outer membrane factor (OMF) lipoprotein
MMAHKGSRAAATPALAVAGVLSWLAVAGCLVGPDYKRPEVPLNASWTGKGDQRLATQTAVDAEWWKAFHDPTLDRLVGLAYRENFGLQIAGLRILEARAQLGIAKGYYYPTNNNPIASGGGGGIHGDTGNGGPLNIYYGQYVIGFDAAWELDFWGKFRRGVRAARANFFATVADYDDALVALTAEIARTYVVIRTFQVLIALARENVAVQEDGQHIAESRFKNGATSGLDVAQATNLLESTRATIPELQIGLQQAENALCTLLARPTGCEQALLSGAEAIPAPPGQVAVSVPAELLRRRPDIRSAELNAVAQCDRIGVAKAQLFPSFSLLGQLGTRTVGIQGAPAAVGQLVGIFNPGTLIYSIGASLFWPILNYPKLLNNVRVEDARFQQALFNYENTVYKAQQEVEDGITGFLKEQEAVVFAQNAVKAAQEAVHLAVVQYKEGAVDYTRVLDAQRALLQSQNLLARARSTVVTNLVALYKALGGGWEQRRDQPVVTDATRSEMQKRTNWGSYFDKPPPTPSQPGGSPPAR